jgi:4-amino-4-deoxy-L-arabinose transferase-like glycosyltransferase
MRTSFGHLKLAARAHKELIPLVFLIVVRVALGLSYSAIVPIWEASDEDSHFAYARYLVARGGLLRPGDPEADAIAEKFQPPLYYLALVPALAPFDLGAAFKPPERNPYLFQGDGGFNYAVHPDELASSAQSLARAVSAARALSVLLSSASLLPVYLAARRIWPAERGVAWAAACLFGFWPQFLFVGSMVTNDGMVTALSAAVFFVSVQVAIDGPRLGTILAEGLALGAALLTKLNAAGLIPLVAMAVLIGLTRRTGRQPRRWMLALLVGTVGAVLAWIGSQPFVTTQLLRQQTVMDLLAHSKLGPSGVMPSFLLSAIGFSLKTFVASFGWGNLEPNPALYWIWGMVADLALIGLVVALVDRARATPLTTLLLAALPIVGLAALALALDVAQQAHLPGRYLLPSLPGVAVASVAGWRALAPRAWRGRIWQAICLVVILVGWSIPFVTLAPAYAKPQPLPSHSTIDHPLALVFGGAVELIGFQNPRPVLSGEAIRVTLCWEAARTMLENYPVQLELVGPDGQPVARLETWPGRGNYPTSLWRSAAPFCDVYAIPMRGYQSLPEPFSIRVGILDGVGGNKLPVETPGGQTAGHDVLITWSP